MERKESYPVEDILKHIAKGKLTSRKYEIDFDGDLIKMNSQRYYLFKHKGCKCKCGVEGVFFAKERHQQATPGRWHFNLYGYRPDGTEVMMTKDHIVSKSRGGANHFDNYEPMCSDCNTKKADKMTREEFEKLFEDTDSDLKNVHGDSAMLGLNILSKYVKPGEDIIKGADHDVIYSLDVDTIVDAGITEDDTKELARLNWCVDEDNDCLISFV